MQIKSLYYQHDTGYLPIIQNTNGIQRGGTVITLADRKCHGRKFVTRHSPMKRAATMSNDLFLPQGSIGKVQELINTGFGRRVSVHVLFENMIAKMPLENIKKK